MSAAKKGCCFTGKANNAREKCCCIWSACALIRTNVEEKTLNLTDDSHLCIAHEHDSRDHYRQTKYVQWADFSTFLRFIYFSFFFCFYFFLHCCCISCHYSRTAEKRNLREQTKCNCTFTSTKNCCCWQSTRIINAFMLFFAAEKATKKWTKRRIFVSTKWQSFIAEAKNRFQLLWWAEHFLFLSLDFIFSTWPRREQDETSSSLRFFETNEQLPRVFCSLFKP